MYTSLRRSGRVTAGHCYSEPVVRVREDEDSVDMKGVHAYEFDVLGL